MNNSTKTAIEIIRRREDEGIRPSYAMWVEVYNAMIAFGITGEQMQRELNAGITAGYLEKQRGINGDIYLRGNGSESTI